MSHPVVYCHRFHFTTVYIQDVRTMYNTYEVLERSATVISLYVIAPYSFDSTLLVHRFFSLKWR